MKKLILILLLFPFGLFAQEVIRPSVDTYRLSSGFASGIFEGATTQKAFNEAIDAYFADMVNNIGNPGQLGYGVGICPPDDLAAYNATHDGEEILAMAGTYNINSDNYGNYQVTHDGSIMVWVPFFWAKYNTDNSVETMPEGYFEDETAANAAGFFLPRAFVNGGIIKRGFFWDKYSSSLTGITASELDASGSLANNGVFSSIKNANPISTDAATLRKLAAGSDNLYAGSIANCRANGKSPANAVYGIIDAVKSRGDDYHCITSFQRQALWLLQRCHQAYASGTTFCAYNGVAPYAPKGNNNYGADYNDAACTFAACDDAYWGAKTAPMEARKTGSGNLFSKTTHNGQNSGISDINGNQYNFLIGITTIAEPAQAIASIDRAAECTVTVTNALATNSNYANGKPVLITGTLTGEWATLLKDKFFAISDISGNTFKLKDKAGAYINTSALSADYVSGLKSTTGKFYILKDSVDVKTITSGASLATDCWGATGVAAMYDEVSPDFIGSYAQRYGSSTNQVFSSETDRTSEAYKLASAGICKDRNGYDASGTAAFGTDYYYMYICNEVAPLAFYAWSISSGAGLGALTLYLGRTYGSRPVSGRAGLYL